MGYKEEQYEYITAQKHVFVGFLKLYMMCSKVVRHEVCPAVNLSELPILGPDSSTVVKCDNP